MPDDSRLAAYCAAAYANRHAAAAAVRLLSAAYSLPGGERYARRLEAGSLDQVLDDLATFLLALAQRTGALERAA
jgi:hypothetical protein